MKTQEWLLTELFKNFIRDSLSGKRLKPNGKKLKPQSIRNYEVVLRLIEEYEIYQNKKLFIKSHPGKNKKVLLAENRYWKKFYHQFTSFLLYKKNCFDNYTGMVFKIMRSFFRYLIKDKMISIGNFYTQFYKCSEEVPVIILLPEQLQFLIVNKEFED